MRGLALVLALSACATAPPAVAFADLNAALTQCREGRAARDELMQTFRTSKAKRERGLDVGEDEAAVRKDLVSVHDEYTKLQSELSAAELRRADAIHRRLERILRELANARGIKEVSDSALAHTDGRRYVDLTADVVRAADAESGRP
jgi:Skp family chaperone for outer membrane proteins